MKKTNTHSAGLSKSDLGVLSQLRDLSTRIGQYDATQQLEVAAMIFMSVKEIPKWYQSTDALIANRNCIEFLRGSEMDYLVSGRERMPDELIAFRKEFESKTKSIYETIDMIKANRIPTDVNFALRQAIAETQQTLKAMASDPSQPVEARMPLLKKLHDLHDAVWRNNMDFHLGE